MADSSDNSKTSCLLKAARFGNLELFKRLAIELDEGDGLQKTLGRIKDENGRTAFHHAAMSGKTNVCRYLHEEVKVDHINLGDGTVGETPLHQAVLFGHYNTAVYLLENGANPNAATVVGDAPLHYVVLKGYKKIIRLLISKGAKVDPISDYGTPLLWAAIAGNVNIVKILLDNLANPNMMIHSRICNPLTEAVVSGSIECVKLLLEAGADPNMVAGGDRSLHIAIAVGADTEFIKCLLDGNANPNAVDHVGRTPLELATILDRHDAVRILYPLTAPFLSIPDWSFDEIKNYVCSEPALKQWDYYRNELFLVWKSEGEEEFKRQEYINAIYWYNQCLIACYDATILSNLSLCWARLNDGCRALTYAEACLSLRPDWPKAHYREGVAWKLLKQFDKAALSFMAGLKLDRQNKVLLAAYRGAIEAFMATQSEHLGHELAFTF